MALFACAWWMWTDTGAKSAAALSPREQRAEPPARATSVMFPRALPVRDGGFGHVNNSCPLHPDDALARPVPEARIAAWRGARVGLCGASCALEWQAWADDQRDAFLRECARPSSGATAGVDVEGAR